MRSITIEMYKSSTMSIRGRFGLYQICSQWMLSRFTLIYFPGSELFYLSIYFSECHWLLMWARGSDLRYFFFN